MDDETLELALQDWEIWLRWERAFYANETTIETHPALPADRARHDILAPLLAARLGAVSGPVIRARAEFRRREGQLEARWTLV